MTSIVDRITDVIKPTIEGMGFILWGVEFKHVGRRSALTVYIDSEENSVSVDDCSDVSRQLSSVLDVEDIITYAYDLEISSPGMDRIFFNLEQLKNYIDNKISFVLNMPVGNYRKFKAILKKIEDTTLTVEVEDGSLLEIIYANVNKARLVPDFDFGKKESKHG